MLISPASPFGPRHEYREVDFEERRDAYEGWHRYNTNYVRENFRGFAEWFNGFCINERHSTKQVEDMVAWTLETTPATMIDSMRAPDTGAGDEETFRRIRCPLLFLHGDKDLNQPVAKSAIWPRYPTDGADSAGVGPCSPGPHPGQGQPDPQGLRRRYRGKRWRRARRDGPSAGRQRREANHDARAVSRPGGTSEEWRRGTSLRSLRRRRTDGPSPADLADRPQPQMEGADRDPGPALSRRYLRRPRQRQVRPAAGRRALRWDHYVGDTIAVMDATRTDRAVVIGNSLGGEVAPLLAIAARSG